MCHPLTAIFVDCDSFFASVEQHLNESLRNRPVGVAPVMAETSCCIAASYEAKAHGVKTGTGVREARILCPGIKIVQARPEEYVRAHHKIIEAVEECIHVEQVLSIDEMWAWLPLNWRDPEFVRGLGMKIKARVTSMLSPAVKVSVGAAPNKYIAKLASKMGKPDGLHIVESRDLPNALHELDLSDFHGVGRSMESRIRAAGIQTAAQLCAAPRELLHGIWGSVLGDRLWFLLQGREIPDLATTRKTIGHSHVLPPDLRTPDQAYPVLCKLLHKASERLRACGMLTGMLQVHLSYLGGPRWSQQVAFQPTCETSYLMRVLRRIWKERPEPRSKILQVGVTLMKLVETANHTPELFPIDDTGLVRADDKHKRLDAALDQLRARYGRDVVFLGSVQKHREAAPMRISFTHIPDLDLEKDAGR